MGASGRQGTLLARAGVVTLAAAALVAAALILGIPAGASTSAPRPFAPTSVWNTRLAGNVALNSASGRLVSALIAQKNASGAWINTTRYSTPIYEASASERTVAVHVDHAPSKYATQLDQDLAHVPMPQDARPSRDRDSRMIVRQDSTDTLWEFWHLHYHALTGWHAGWGGKISGVSQSPGVYPRPFGSTASGLSLLGGLITLDDIRAGSIDHMLALGVPRVTKGVIVAPATRTDGRYRGVNTIPEGTRFRLDPDLDLDSLSLPPATRMIAEAAQRYGMVVRDGSGAVVLYAQDPTPTGSDPYRAWFDHQSPAAVMRRFPWRHLQALAPTAG